MTVGRMAPSTRSGCSPVLTSALRFRLPVLLLLLLLLPRVGLWLMDSNAARPTTSSLTTNCDEIRSRLDAQYAHSMLLSSARRISACCDLGEEGRGKDMLICQTSYLYFGKNMGKINKLIKRGETNIHTAKMERNWKRVSDTRNRQQIKDWQTVMSRLRWSGSSPLTTGCHSWLLRHPEMIFSFVSWFVHLLHLTTNKLISTSLRHLNSHTTHTIKQIHTRKHAPDKHTHMCQNLKYSSDSYEIS